MATYEFKDMLTGTVFTGDSHHAIVQCMLSNPFQDHMTVDQYMFEYFKRVSVFSDIVAGIIDISCPKKFIESLVFVGHLGDMNDEGFWTEDLLQRLAIGF